ncbi:hypothetical protein AVEN_161565-1 [Araneus ventricosus]|uniref:Uncharacterized protein n=1 Tax=Araneus ventricosus TaxID=182803 RepID=A0A4Y2NKG2_ARAVE|nr:hypothetical protein AVEN_161565-1 [Araneus ventricosus]
MTGNIDGKSHNIRSTVTSQIAILVCSNLALQICQLAASLTRQEGKLETSYCKRVSHHASNLQQAFLRQTHLKTIAKSTQTNLRFEHLTTLFLNLSSSPLSQRDFDCVRQIALQKDCSSRFILKCLLDFIKF